ncbi:MAG: CCA tRNA nucleotidyltransferase [Deltaproteobacteria bacterium]|nr:CCA tRNA nucleotidyltransferase [Candidatus Zymogenaceae bacterium]
MNHPAGERRGVLSPPFPARHIMQSIDLTRIITDLDTLYSALEPTCREAFLVGGAIRDHFLGASSTDFDIVVWGDPESAAKTFARKTRGTFVILDSEEDIYRVAKGGETYDFCAPKGPDAASDARDRDFTINALSARVWPRGDGTDTPLIDPTGGLSDLAAGVIRVPSLSVLSTDPVRMLRAFRFAATLGFTIDPKTTDEIHARCRDLLSGARERIRDEWTKLLSADLVYPVIRRMDDAGILPVMFPEIETMRGVSQNRFHSYDVWGHSLACLEEVELLLTTYPERLGGFEGIIRPYLARPLGGGWTGASLLKLTALFHDVGKPVTRDVREDGEATFYGHENKGAVTFRSMCLRLLMGRRAVRTGTVLIKNHMRLLSLSRMEKITPRALGRLIRDVGDNLPGVVLLGLADTGAGHTDGRRVDNGDMLARSIMEAYLRVLSDDDNTPAPLLSGRDIMKIADIGQGVLVGRLKSELLEAQAAGEVTTKGAAEWFITKRADALKLMRKEHRESSDGQR